MKKIYLVRHCATQLNDQDRVQGSWMDWPLSENGKAQAVDLGKSIRAEMGDEKFDYIFVSPSSRTIETAKAIENKKPIIDERILVYDIGTADALKIDEVKNIKGFPIPGVYKKMENPLKYYNRVKSFFEDIKNNPQYNDSNILIVTHKDITALANHFLTGEKLLESLKKGLKNGKFKTYFIENIKENEEDAEKI